MMIQNDSLGFSQSQAGGHSSRLMMFMEMCILVRALPVAMSGDEIIAAIVEENILGKPTLSSRKKSAYSLKQLYGMDPSKVLFRVLWEMGHEDYDSLACLEIMKNG